MKRRIVDFVIIMALTFMLGYSANWVTRLVFFQVAFPQLIALDGFHWEDFVFKLRPDTKREDRITLINISEGNRLNIAQQIDLISSYNPKVIGVNVFFNCWLRDTINCPQMLDASANLALSRAIKNSDKVVLVTSLRQTTAGVRNDIYDSLEFSDPEFSNYAKNGFANLVSESNDSLSAKQCRSFVPSIEINKVWVNSFAVEVAMTYDSIKANKFLARGNEEELINYRGNVGGYYYSVFNRTIFKDSYFDVLDYDDLQEGDFNQELIKGRIILLGYLGAEYLEDPAYENRFYTPLNSTMSGRSLPDMLGLVVQANIISMILNEDAINEFSEFWDFAVMLMVISLNIILFMFLLQKNTVWFDSLGFIIPVIQIILISWLRIELLSVFGFRLDLENIIYLLAFVTFAVNIYFGPFKQLIGKLKSKLHSGSKVLSDNPTS